MRIPPFSRFRGFMRISAVFVLGAVFGSVVYNALFHAAYNELWLDNFDYRVQIAQYEKDISTLKKYSSTSTVIREIKLRAEQADGQEESGLNQATVKDILARMNTDLEPLRGRSVFDIDADGKMARTLLGGKRYAVRDKEYAVHIRTMLVMEGVLQIWVEIRPVGGGG